MMTQKWILDKSIVGCELGKPGTELDAVVSTAIGGVLSLGCNTRDCGGEFFTFKAKAKIQVWPPNTEQSNYTEDGSCHEFAFV